MDTRNMRAASSAHPLSGAFPDKKAGKGLSGGCIPFVFPGVERVSCLFTTVAAGNMALTPFMAEEEKAAVTANRRTLMERGGLDGWVELLQVHKDGMILDPAPTDPEIASTLEGDGACTRRAGLALAVKSADCQPVLLTDVRGSAIAALHVGWRGNAIHFPVAGVHRFCKAYDIAAGDVMAVRGPSLGPGAAEFVNFTEEWPAEFLPWYREAGQTMDLWSLTRHQLIEAGILPEHIFSLDLCTFSLPELFYSFRRGHAGRQVSLIWLKNGSGASSR